MEESSVRTSKTTTHSAATGPTVDVCATQRLLFTTTLVPPARHPRLKAITSEDGVINRPNRSPLLNTHLLLSAMTPHVDTACTSLLLPQQPILSTFKMSKKPFLSLDHLRNPCVCR
ncbi:hypothetical protein L596_001186 [Steinernema carpocapsae]|uniref:Uncharacterized protein n=1 Tax=Steinernema carpocapsae TaxID=34508 RepID=A0A4U8UPK1_STECR|nr:hypothetical protein L596_001186 [Steinernema carpocapsae]